MNQNLKAVTLKRLQETAQNLQRNNMDATVCETGADALKLLKSYLPEGCVVGVGGSETLNEIGAIDLLRSGDYQFLDRYKPELSPADMKQIFRDSFSADVYVMSANAVTETGALVNVDGRSNRCAALLFGPDTVVVIAGSNKLVPDVDAAFDRIKTVAAPANATRLHCETPCTKTGRCISVTRGGESELCEGCASERRICASYVVSAHQGTPGRIKVILVAEPLGF